MKAIIMAGGQGTRLRPLTCDLPKPMVPLLNKPVMEYSIELLKDHGITEIGVTTCYLPEMIKDYFGDGSNRGVHLYYFQEDEPLGTAGSVRNAAEFLDETFIVISGDALTDVNLSEVISYHKEKKGLVTIVLNRQEIPLEYGVVMINQDGCITRFLEKPTWGEVFSDLANTGIYLLEPEIFNYFPKGVKFDFSKDLFPLLMQNGQPLYGYITETYWSDIGDVEQYMQTQFDILNGKVDVYIRGNQIEEGIWVGEGTDIPGDVHLAAPIYIGEEVMIKPETHLEATVIGNYCVVEDGCSVKRSIIWSGVYLGKNCEIRAGFLCDGVTVKEHVRVFEGAVIGKDSTVGRKVTVQPGVKIWPLKTVEDYTNLTTSLVWEPKWRKRLFNTYGVHGLANLEITPEFVAKLATAYGSTHKAGTELGISTDNYNVSKMLQKAVISGLLSSGLKVVDFGEMPSPVTRYAIPAMQAKGGIHIRCCYDNPEEIILEFIDEKGVNISRNNEREIERKFFCEDFKRAAQENVGDYYFAPQVAESYLHTLADLVNRENIRRERFQLVVDYEFDCLSQILPVLLDKLGCEIDLTYNYGQNRPLSYAERLATSNKIAIMVEELNADMGVIIDHNGENLTLLTEDGRIVTDEELQIILAMVLVHQGLRDLVVSVNSPAYIETLVQEYGGKVTRVRNDRTTLMREFLIKMQKESKHTFFPYNDGIAALTFILDFLADQRISLGQLVKSIPTFYTCIEEVECPWEKKGTVMRRLIESTNGEEVQLVDGVRIHNGHGWTLIYPDVDEPIFHVYTEANDPEIASEISGDFAQRVLNFRHH